MASHLLLFLFLVGCQTIERQGSISPNQVRSEPAPPVRDYLISEGELLEIKHIYNPELDETVTVRLDGKISLPLIDDIVAAGMTPSELDRKLTEMYRKHVLKPELTVIVRKPQMPVAYIGGEVVRPGPIPLKRNTTIIQAIFESGGIRKTGEAKTVVVLRNKGTDVPEFIIVDVEKQLLEPGSKGNLRLRHQDIVFVPASQIAQANLFIEQYIDKMLPFFRSINLNYDIQQISAGK